MKRIYVEKKQNFCIESLDLKHKINLWLNINIDELKILNVYDVDNIDIKTWDTIVNTILSEPNIDSVYDTYNLDKVKYVATKSLPAQFDIRAESAIQCIQIQNPNSQPKVWVSKLFIFPNNISQDQLSKIKNMLINKVEMEEKDLSIYGDKLTLNKKSIETISGFCLFDSQQLMLMSKEMSLSYDDLLMIQTYYKEDEKRDPTDTELKLFETYWSDHCRHTTFETTLTDINIEEQPLKKNIQDSLDYFLELKNNFRKDKPITLMNIATIMTKKLVSQNLYTDVEKSSEVNACGVFADVKVDDKIEKWLIQFKNETHNHPTEIEPFGGAATCLGGAIRDPLSGRSYVYQGLRLSGAGNPIENIALTIPNKLPQQKISKMSAEGFSSYGNQIGLATAYVQELVHPGYKAKHMEVGVVVGASPANHVVRIEPKNNDIIILIGGKTGRDGIGGATGSSKEHTDKSLLNSSAEVQKGNPIEERKIQRLFRNPSVTKLIKKSNDFGAGGASVAISELSDSIEINLDAIPLKYKGLNGTDIAISESQERMAIVIDPKNLEIIKQFCDSENLESTYVAKITNNGRLIMKWENQIIVNISRKFLNTNGFTQKTQATIGKQGFIKATVKGDSIESQFKNVLMNPNVASQKGLQQLFDFSIGGSTILSPYGGTLQLSPSQTSVQKLPVGNKYTDTSTMVSFGFDPYLSEASPYLGGMHAVIESIAKIVAAGGNLGSLKLSFQEYFERLNKDPVKWGKPLASLLGTLEVMKVFNIAAIGGKDSMSGTFHNLNVPPTLISFAFSVVDANNIISTDFKKTNSNIYIFTHERDANGLPDINKIKSNLEIIEKYISDKKINSAFAIERGGVAAALAKMSFGNNVGFNISTKIDLFDEKYGSIIVESEHELDGILIGRTANNWIVNGETINKNKMLNAWTQLYEKLFPIVSTNTLVNSNIIHSPKINSFSKSQTKIVAQPKVLIPVFPGTNCEFDIERKFTREGAICKQLVFSNKTNIEIQKSLKLLSQEIIKTDILVFAGGFSSSDEPDGSGKFIVSVLKNPLIKQAISTFRKRGGFILGICNGFQALIKSGLLPFGNIQDLQVGNATLFKNDLNSHISKYVNTKVSSTNSPWLSKFKLNQIHTIPISHGEGKFIVNKKDFETLSLNNQIAFQYVDSNNELATNNKSNPNGSNFAIEGIVSSDGMILGKMAHSERYEKNIAKNIYGDKDQNIFKNIIKYLQGEK